MLFSFSSALVPGLFYVHLEPLILLFGLCALLYSALTTLLAVVVDSKRPTNYFFSVTETGLWTTQSWYY